MHAQCNHPIGNIEDDLSKLPEVDWVVEAVIENPTSRETSMQTWLNISALALSFLKHLDTSTLRVS